MVSVGDGGDKFSASKTKFMVSEWRLRQGLAFVAGTAGGARVGVGVRCWHSPRGRQPETRCSQPGSEEGLSLSSGRALC